MKELFITLSVISILIISAVISYSSEDGKPIIKTDEIEKCNNIDKTEDLLSKSRFGIRIGTGYEMNYTENDDHEDFIQLSLGVFYNGRYFDIEIYGITPHSKATLFSSIININPFTHFGIGVGYLYVYDDLARDNKDELDDEYYKGEYHAALFGINIRAFDNLRASIYFGMTLKGEISYQDKDNEYYKYEIENHFGLLRTAVIINIEYRFNDVISVMLSYHQNGGEGDLTEKPAGDSVEDKRYMNTKFITVSMGYSISY